MCAALFCVYWLARIGIDGEQGFSFGGAGRAPRVDAHRDRKLMRLFHPDHYTNAPAEVRTKMVEAYRLVSESRPDA